MLAIRMQRRGRKGRAHFRVIVQDSRLSPMSGRVVAHLGHHDPHSKDTVIDTEKAAFYLKNGAQPSPRVARVLKELKVKLPTWVAADTAKKSSVKNPEKLRKNQPDEPVAEAAEDEPKTEVASDESAPAEPETEAPEESKDSEVDTKEEAADDAKPEEAEKKPDEKTATKKA